MNKLVSERIKEMNLQFPPAPKPAGVYKPILVIDMDLIEEGIAPRVFINAEILEDAGNSVIEEGCLSIPDIRENVERPELIKVKYLDIDGIEHVEECGGMLARVLQHEIDHLHGVLFIDRLSSIKRSLLAKKLKKLAAGA